MYVPLVEKSAVLTFAVLGCVAGCALPVEEAERIDGPTREEVAPLLQGTATMARPEIGRVFRGGASWCTATLIAPRYVLTAAHCLNKNDYRDTIVRPGDKFAMTLSSGSLFSVDIDKWYSFGHHFEEKIWNGWSSDVAIGRLVGIVPSTTATPVQMAEVRSKSSTAWSTRFGYGCNNRDTIAWTGTGFGFKRYLSFQGLVTNTLCPGDSGGPTLMNQGELAAPIWGVNSGGHFDLSAGGVFDIVADAGYTKKQIEGLMIAWDGDQVSMSRSGGGTYRTVALAAPFQCANACINDTACRSWVWGGGQCYLQDAIGSLVPGAPGTSTGIVRDRFNGLEVNYDRPGNDFWSGTTVTRDDCRKLCADDYRCSAFSTNPTGGLFACRMKDGMSPPVRSTNFASGAKRGLDMDAKRSGATLLHHFTYSTPGPEICQAECSKRSNCVSFNYTRLANGALDCKLYSTAGSRVSASGFVSGLRNRMFQ